MDGEDLRFSGSADQGLAAGASVCEESGAAGLRGIEVESAFEQVDEIVVIGEIGEIGGVSGVAAVVWACFPE